MTAPTSSGGGARPLGAHRFVRAGAFAWSALGLALVVAAALWLVDIFRLAVVPLVLALFPAAILWPLAVRLKRRLRPALAALILVLGTTVSIFGMLGFFAWLIADQVPAVIDSLREAYDDIRGYLSERFDVGLPDVDELLDRAQGWATGGDLQTVGLSFAIGTLEVLSSLLLIIVALFFYLKDGERLADFAVRLAPARLHGEVAEVGQRVWDTLGGYFRGQLLVAAVDAFFIGIGLVLLGVPLALPLAVLVFFGGLFPIVGAFTAGALAVLVALADRGLVIALAVLALNIVVQQAEGNLLEPLIVGRATRLHPLAIIAALTAGGVTLGILGAFLAVPVTACVTRVVGYLRERPNQRLVSGDGAALLAPSTSTGTGAELAEP